MIIVSIVLPIVQTFTSLRIFSQEHKLLFVCSIKLIIKALYSSFPMFLISDHVFYSHCIRLYLSLSSPYAQILQLFRIPSLPVYSKHHLQASFSLYHTQTLKLSMPLHCLQQGLYTWHSQMGFKGIFEGPEILCSFYMLCIIFLVKISSFVFFFIFILRP